MPRIQMLCAVSLSIVWCTSCGCSEEKRLFKELQRARRDTEAARRLSERLAESEAGLALAFDDFNSFGGTTRGWSSWIIEHASASNVNVRLNVIRTDSRAAMSKRISATWLLWRRTSEEKYLQSLFALVHAPGPKSVETGRHWLAGTLRDKETSSRLRLKSSEGLTMTEEEFTDALQAARMGGELGQAIYP